MKGMLLKILKTLTPVCEVEGQQYAMLASQLAGTDSSLATVIFQNDLENADAAGCEEKSPNACTCRPRRVADADGQAP